MANNTRASKMRAQHVVNYIFFIIISITIVFGLFAFARDIESKTESMVVQKQVQAIGNKITYYINYGCKLNKTLNLSFSVPPKIGYKEYTIYGLGKSIVIKPFAGKKYKYQTYCPYNISGSLSPQDGQVHLMFLPKSNKIILK